MKKIFAIASVSMLIFMIAVAALAKDGSKGINDPYGVPLYVIIEVEWDGNPENNGDWKVWGPAWDPVLHNGTILTSCTVCLDMSNYEFRFHGNTVHFKEVMVPTVRATPQARHVVLKDRDGDGIYTGSLVAMHYFPWRAESDGSWAILYFDRIDYEITFDRKGNVTDFYYVQYEHKKLE